MLKFFGRLLMFALTFGIGWALFTATGFMPLVEKSVAIAISQTSSLPLMAGLVVFTVAYAALDKWSDSINPFRLQFSEANGKKYLTIRNPGGILSIAVPILEILLVNYLSQPHLINTVAFQVAVAVLQYNLLVFVAMGAVIIICTSLGWEVDLACMDTRVNEMIRNGTGEACMHDADCGAFSLLKISSYVFLWVGVGIDSLGIMPWLSNFLLETWVCATPVIFVFWKFNLGRDANGRKTHILTSLTKRFAGESAATVVGKLDDILMFVTETVGSLIGALMLLRKPRLQHISH